MPLLRAHFSELESQGGCLSCSGTLKQDKWPLPLPLKLNIKYVIFFKYKVGFSYQTAPLPVQPLIFRGRWGTLFSPLLRSVD